MKEPHNYRKVGYSMIVVSISLTLIGLLVWAIGNNYHYSSDRMAVQEIDSMTPKSGYSICSYDNSQPVGSKLRLLDHASSYEDALKLKEKYSDLGVPIEIFGPSLDLNQKLLAEATSATGSSGTGTKPPVTANVQNLTNANSTGNKTITLVEKLDITAISSSNSSMNVENQTNKNGTKSVNLTENVTITSK